MSSSTVFFFFFFNDTATTEIYTLSLHDALPISRPSTPRLATRRSTTTMTGASGPAGGRGASMGAETGIAWTDHTFNPWWGCTRVSPGCEHCYAESWDARWSSEVHPGRGAEHWGPEAPRRFFGETHWNEPRAWNRKALAAGRLHKVFCASMADVFEKRE